MPLFCQNGGLFDFLFELGFLILIFLSPALGYKQILFFFLPFFSGETFPSRVKGLADKPSLLIPRMVALVEGTALGGQTSFFLSPDAASAFWFAM